MALAKFFRFPFGTTGDKTTIPDGVQPGGAVSYTEGFGPDYALPSTDPDRKPVPRRETNQYLYDITTAIREFQTLGIPDAITSAQNGGTAFSYALNAIVRGADGLIYRSTANSNTTLPPGATWLLDEALSFAALLASEAQARARTDNTKFMSALRVAQAIEQRGIDNSGAGWERSAGSNILRQWGNITVNPSGTSTAQGSFSFPIPFVSVASQVVGNLTDRVNGSWSAGTVIIKPTSVTGGTWLVDSTDPTQLITSATTIGYMAIGV